MTAGRASVSVTGATDLARHVYCLVALPSRRAAATAARLNAMLAGLQARKAAARSGSSKHNPVPPYLVPAVYKVLPLTNVLVGP